VDLLYSCHELVHEVTLVLGGHSLLSQTKIQGIFEIGFVVGATVEDNWQGLAGVDTSGSCIKSKLANLSNAA
jgi:hypothetical protein